jgi:hypothetical protein
MRQTVHRDIESAGRGEDDELAPRMREPDREREQQQAAEERDVEHDDAERHGKDKANAPPERLAIDRRDACRVARDEVAAPLHGGDRSPEAEGAQIGRAARRQGLLRCCERSLDLRLVHACQRTLGQNRNQGLQGIPPLR